MQKILKIDNTDISHIVSYTVTYCKLWASDTGRSMTGENKGTLVGIFPKLEISLGRMTDDQMAAFLALVNAASRNVTYYDTEKQKLITNSFYFGDAADSIRKQSTLSHSPIKISIIANRRRSDE